MAEGDDKPFKYPAIFACAQAAVIAKLDLLPHVSFDVAAAREQIATLNPTSRILPLSARDGDGVDVSTMNGGVSVTLPDNYSARLETGTVNGGLHVDFPVAMSGEVKRQLSTTLGAGGALIRVKTTNGGVSIKRRTI